ncbi:MAG: cadmium-translocating P-type ATPase [Bacteroidetes bacterium]|nr:cadmium-translocating P-type ATPase [Bacteroidota bacterium]MBS1741027.1 cadmium-translocating P-type ATPase [Bacteroidota bacterium]
MEKTISTKVEGMTCGNCALTISKLLEKKGMKNVSANAASGEVSFTIVNDINEEKIFDDIDDLGYKVIRDSADPETHDHDHDSHTILWIICIALTIPLLMHMFVSWPWLHNPFVQLTLSTPVYLIGCYAFLPSALRSLKHRIPNMDVLIMLGATAAYFYSIIGLVAYAHQAHHYLFFETTASIITLVMAGNWIEHRTVKSTTVAIDALVKLQPQFAKIVMTDSLGKDMVMEIESKFIKQGDIVLVNNGDKIPVDGTVVFGDAQVDEHMITGESVPVHKITDSEVVGGTLVADGVIKIKATKVGHASVLSNIIRMVREAQGSKPRLQKLADKISAIFVPLVLLISLLTLAGNYFLAHLSFPEAMMRSIAVLVVACPCAMGLATPAAIAVGLGRAARNGILIKGGDTLEALKTVKQIVFDKTGTLTTGKLQIEDYIVDGIEESFFKSIILSIETHSSHPIAKSIVEQWSTNNKLQLSAVEEVKGKGMQAFDDQGHVWKLGSQRWLHNHSDTFQDYDLYLYQNDQFRGALRISDALRLDAVDTIAELKKMGYETILLSGDTKRKCSRIAEHLGIQTVFAEQSPEQKNLKLDELMKRAPTAMVGDGINDAPALARATVGISLSESTQIAIQSANLILSNNQLSTLPKAIRLGIFTEQTIKQNLFWAFFYNILAIPVAATGYLSPTWGAGIMAMSDIVLILNSLRLGLRNINS